MSSTTITIRINGGKPLKGEVSIAPNKNAILPAIAASILTDEVMSYRNMPINSPDVHKMLLALKEMGAIVDTSTATVTICCAGLDKDKKSYLVPSRYINDMQAAYLFAGPLLARFGTAIIPISSGCKLGYRSYEEHAQYLAKLGVQFTLHEDSIEFTLADSISDPRVVVVDEQYDNKRSVTYRNPLVTPTENVLMLLAKTSRYSTEVSGIAQEPHVAQLLDLLYRMGAHVKGKGSTVSITGADKLRGVEFIAEPDHVDYFGFASMAAMTKSDIFLRVPTNPLCAGIAHMNEFLEDIGVQFEVIKEGVMIRGSKSSYTPSGTFPKADKDTYKMNPSPAPGFSVDCLPCYIALSTMNPDPNTATRTMNWMYTDGLRYIPVMEQMGAKIKSFDWHHVVVTGGTEGGNPYEGKTSIVTAPGVIEGERAIISCALAGGTHTIHSGGYILRRNPNFFEILQSLGADIEVDNPKVHVA